MPQPEESSLLRLASARGGEAAFLLPHHLAAAERLERMIGRALLSPRLTMSYDGVNSGRRGRGGSNHAADMSDTVAEARQKLNILAGKLPADCWNVVFDVCGLGKGLQAIETERSWPRRGAKLVLRVALDLLASEWGLSPHVARMAGAGTRGWLEERLPLITRAEAC
ncbi:DUF6456 domain-containing protein [Devosia submarina]|uniref:DUF6456 domain-containing protein n=1 Tax=Devosia submarina TaxID=1173082 RepID=UPI0013009DBC|nr:DUF6456 domain-containing protein [Devosia submarina]